MSPVSIFVLCVVVFIVGFACGVFCDKKDPTDYHD